MARLAQSRDKKRKLREGMGRNYKSRKAGLRSVASVSESFVSLKVEIDVA